MNETDWVKSDNIEDMIRYITSYHVGAVDYFELPRDVKIFWRKLKLWCKESLKPIPTDGRIVSFETTPWQNMLNECNNCIRSCVRIYPSPEATRLCDLLRHIIGNPFRPSGTKYCDKCDGEGQTWELKETHPYIRYMVPPMKYKTCWECQGKGYIKIEYPEWPTKVTQLAESLEKGENCDFALRDELLDLGQIEFADHFQDVETGIIKKESQHPEGCWVLDFILGKE